MVKSDWMANEYVPTSHKTRAERASDYAGTLNRSKGVEA